MPPAITIEFPKAVQKSASSKMNAYASKPKRYAGLKNGALRKLCQKMSPSGKKITTAVMATTVVRGRLKVRAVIRAMSFSRKRELSAVYTAQSHRLPALARLTQMYP